MKSRSAAQSASLRRISSVESCRVRGVVDPQAEERRGQGVEHVHQDDFRRAVGGPVVVGSGKAGNAAAIAGLKQLVELRDPASLRRVGHLHLTSGSQDVIGLAQQSQAGQDGGQGAHHRLGQAGAEDAARVAALGKRSKEERFLVKDAQEGRQDRTHGVRLAVLDGTLQADSQRTPGGGVG